MYFLKDIHARMSKIEQSSEYLHRHFSGDPKPRSPGENDQNERTMTSGRDWKLENVPLKGVEATRAVCYCHLGPKLLIS